ncbi:hypothetical protein A0H81_12940 [Grifola frondosa]|uniref:Uncharacterized protein n=1 Tax=Grifola frondosa TaxID=5627 RepID=A0A1C7LQX6_GRIFR|nr:hypothetical protein A0H81_12940 [Grifola frondosa]
MSMQPGSGHWLADHLCDLMASPHVSIPSHVGGVYVGPGPVDLFSTRFESWFLPDAKGTVAGREVDREGLKEALLALQTKWDPENVKIRSDPDYSHTLLQDHTQMRTELEWTPKTSDPETDQKQVIDAEAAVVAQEGRERIRFLTLKGDEALFRVTSPGHLEWSIGACSLLLGPI